MFHEIIALILFSIIALAGLAITIFGIGGTFLVLAGALIYNLVSWSMTISLNALLWITGLAILGEILEYLITMIGLKATGASQYSLIGTIIGGFAGAMLLSFIPIIGTIIGLLLGAILGAYILEYFHTRNSKKAWKAAKTALMGRMIVSLSKFIIAIIQIVIVLKIIQF